MEENILGLASDINIWRIRWRCLPSESQELGSFWVCIFVGEHFGHNHFYDNLQTWNPTWKYLDRWVDRKSCFFIWATYFLNTVEDMLQTYVSLISWLEQIRALKTTIIFVIKRDLDMYVLPTAFKKVSTLQKINKVLCVHTDWVWSCSLEIYSGMSYVSRNRYKPMCFGRS